nr:unnamed protein product [Gossypium raimondii]
MGSVISDKRSALYFYGSEDHDIYIPFTGSEAWTRSIRYKIVDEWRPWIYNGQVSGYLQGYENNLTFLTIKWCLGSRAYCARI